MISPILLFILGEFFLAELIESQDESHKTIVADVSNLTLSTYHSMTVHTMCSQVGGHAIGFLSVTTQVDVDLLNFCYQLEPFHGLKRPVEEDEIRSITTLGMDVRVSLPGLYLCLKQPPLPIV